MLFVVLFFARDPGIADNKINLVELTISHDAWFFVPH